MCKYELWVNMNYGGIRFMCKSKSWVKMSYGWGGRQTQRDTHTDTDTDTQISTAVLQYHDLAWPRDRAELKTVKDV